MKSTTVKTKDKDIIESLRGLLGQMLETELVQALLVPRLLPGKDGFVQSLVTDPEMLKDANPLAPTMPVQSAQILTELTSSPFEGRIGAVVKPCELRAVVELAKFLQIDLDNIVTIGVDCLGTYEARDFSAMVGNDNRIGAHPGRHPRILGIEDTLDDQFTGPTNASVKSPRFFCVPVRKEHNGEIFEIINEEEHLTLYDIGIQDDIQPQGRKALEGLQVAAERGMDHGRDSGKRRSRMALLRRLASRVVSAGR